jgi:hypothetical protein
MKRRLQVFVSSTFTDLLLERQAAVSAILKAGHIPAGMELFTAADRSQMETIKQWIDESDVYMLILGGRYGTIEPTSGVSYTELEYDYALQQSKPVFAVVVTDAALEARVKSAGSSYMEKENPKELALFRKKVLSNISSFFEDPKDIKLCVHESLADFAANRDLKGWVPGDELIDTKPLFDEIRKLTEESRRLKEALAEREARASSQNARQSESFQELRKVLRAIEIRIPADVSPEGKESASDLLRLFFGNKERIISGVINAHGTSKADLFCYYNVCPKLQVHGLTENEKVPGVRYRRYAVTKLGNAFLADMERMLLLQRETEKADEQVVPPVNRGEVEKQADSTSTSVPKIRRRRKSPSSGT